MSKQCQKMSKNVNKCQKVSKNIKIPKLSKKYNNVKNCQKDSYILALELIEENCQKNP